VLGRVNKKTLLLGIYGTACQRPQIIKLRFHHLPTDFIPLPDMLEQPLERGAVLAFPAHLVGEGLVQEQALELAVGVLVNRAYPDVSNPLTLAQTTTGQEPDIVGFKLGREVGGTFVPLNYDLLTSIGGLNLDFDGFDVTLEGCARATGGNDALLTWNTTYDPPGLHFLQPRLTLNGTGNALWHDRS